MQHSVFISGAAQGIGAEIARIFHRHGYKVGIYDINDEQALRLANELGENAKAGYLDVSNFRQWKMALQDFKNWAGELNILINNAGILYSGAFEDTSIQSHHRTVDINIKGVLNGCHAGLPHLEKASFARVINLSSASAIYGQADLASYSASKFAVRGLTEALDVEWQKYNIDAGSIQNIGVDLTPADVAKQVLQLAQQKDHALIPTHTPVGIKTKLMYQLSSISPQFLNRLTNIFLSKR